ncbi:MAG: hypothetical protein MNPFHGCM_02548 [Gemmatimonadaceae bacterium]|nr:hypothetical protein [Gemmatimonadaceae bacterium]
MTGTPTAAAGDDAFLTLRIIGGPGGSERLLLIGRPRDGQVRVREWTTDTLNSPGREYDVDAAVLAVSLDEAAASGSSLGAELYRVHLWLRGLPESGPGTTVSGRPGEH